MIAGTLRDQGHAHGPVAPILHGKPAQLPAAIKKVVETICPTLVAVPERALGDGIVARTRTVRNIRSSLNELGFYCPLHLLGTGNPLSIIAYAMAGADCFDGLEWCQTVVDHSTGKLCHYQHWDLFRHQTLWGINGILPYNQSVLMHNLEFYRQFMDDLCKAMKGGDAKIYLKKYASEAESKMLMDVIEGGD